MAARLKTFCYADGFHAWTVATTSRAKALEAFGVTRDLFKDGSAREIDEGPDREAALQTPGRLIERGLAELEKVVTAKPRRTRRPDKAAARAREAVRALESELAELDARHARENADLEARRKALEAEAKRLAEAQAKMRERLKARLTSARSKLDP